MDMGAVKENRFRFIRGRLALICHITGYTYSALAYQAGLPQGTLGTYNTGDVSVSEKILSKISSLVGVPIEFFTEEKITITLRAEKIIKIRKA